MREEEGLEGAGHPEVEEEVALLVPKEFTSSMALSTFSCICYQKSVSLSCHVFLSSIFSFKITTLKLAVSFCCLKLSNVYVESNVREVYR